MALFNYDDLSKIDITLSTEAADLESYDYLQENRLFKSENSICISDSDSYDIFLSHSYQDRKIIPQLKYQIESLGYKVYVDWIDDKLLGRDNVTPKTAEILQKRMKQSKSLLFATSENSTNSKWMPWELGYFDGLKNKRVAILPIKTKSNSFSDDFKGQEYLGLYYWVDTNTIKNTLFVNESISKHISFNQWLNGKEPS